MATLSEVTTVNTGGTWTCSDALWASGFGLWLMAGFKSTPAVTDLQTSPDTTTWTMRTMPATATYRALAYASTLGTIGRAVAVGNGVAAWSDDGVTWTAATSLPEANNWCDVIWWSAQSIFVACASSGTHRIMTSTDGKSWTNQTAASALSWAGLAVSGTVAVCVAFSSSASTQRVQTSADGAAWTLQTHPSIKTDRGLVGGGAARLGIDYSATLGMFLITGTDGSNITYAYRSTDSGVTWTASSTIPTISNTTNRGYVWLSTIAQWYMPCANFNYGTSADGITWIITAFPGGIANSGYTPIGWNGSSRLLGGSTLGFDTALLVAVSSFDSVSPSKGTTRGGTLLTLHGAGLGSVAAGDVLVGGIAAQSVAPATNGLSVTCLTPAHASGAVDVTITGVGTLTAAYTYVSVDRVRPASGTTFGGTAVTITGAGFDLATGVTFAGTAATAIAYVSNTSITCVTPLHSSGLVDVAVLGVDTLTDGYTYVIAVDLLPPFPYYSPVVEGGKPSDVISGPWATWIRTVKARVEALPGSVPAESVIGAFTADQIPQLPFSRLTMSAPRLLGRTTAGSGDAEEIEVGATLSLASGLLNIKGLPSGYTIGDLLYADSATTLARLAIGATSKVLTSTGALPAWALLVNANIDAAAAIAWTKIDKTGSSLADLTTRSAGDLSSGTLLAARMPALTGDITSTVGTVATTLATVNANVGTFGSTTQAPQITVNAKGLITAAANVTVAPTGMVTGSGTAGKLAKWTSASVVGDSLVTETTGGAGTLTTGAAWTMNGSAATPGQAFSALTVQGNFAAPTGSYLGFVYFDAVLNATASSKAQLNLYVDTDCTGSGSGYSASAKISINDSGSGVNTVFGADIQLVASGGAVAKTLTGVYASANSTLTAAQDSFGVDAAATPSGAATSGTRNAYGIRARALPSGMNGGTDNVYGGHFSANGAVTSGVINNYGLYVANGGAVNTTGTSLNIGLYVEAMAGADTNYAAIFAGGNVGIGLTNPAFALDITGTLHATGAVTFGSTLGVTGVATFTAAPVFSSGTASQTMELDGSKALTTVAITGTGNYVKSASPTLTGTITAAALNLSGTLASTAALISITNASAELQVKISGGLTMTLQPGFFGTSTNDSFVLLLNNGTAGKFHASKGFSWGDTTDPGASNMRIAGTLTVVGAATLSSTLGVTGASTLTGDVTAAAKTIFTGITALSLVFDGSTKSNDKDPGAGTIVRVTSTVNSGNALLTGLTGGTDGRILIILNSTSSLTISLMIEDTGSTAANRFGGQSSTTDTISPGQSCIVVYDGTSSRWRPR